MMRRLAVWLSWPSLGPVIALVIGLLIAAGVADAFVSRQQAVDSLNQARAKASARIDQLLHQIDRLQNRVAENAQERGRLEEAIKILAQQVRRMGGEPVVTYRVTATPTPQRSPQPSSHRPASPRPSPRPSPSHSPSTSPTCDVQHLLRCLPT